MENLYISNADCDNLITYTSVFIIPPDYSVENHKTERPEAPRKPQLEKPCLELLKQLFSSPDLKVDNVNLLLKQNEEASKTQQSLDNVEIKSENSPEEITIEEHDIKLEVEESESNEHPTDVATVKDNSKRLRIDSSSSSYCSVGRDWLEADSESSEVASEFFDETFWEPPKLRKGEIYMVPASDDADQWTPAKLVKRLPQKHYKLLQLSTMKSVKVNKHFIAQSRPPDPYIQVGWRVIAPLRTFIETGEVKGCKKNLRLGVVAEYPSGFNGFRYLIIFDNGHWLYVKSALVRPIFGSCKKVWKMVPEERKEEVKNYLKGNFRPVAQYQKGQLVQMDKNGGVLYGDVMAIDASLVLVQFQSASKAVWIHRGCPLLKQVS